MSRLKSLFKKISEKPLEILLGFVIIAILAGLTGFFITSKTFRNFLEERSNSKQVATETDSGIRIPILGTSSGEKVSSNQKMDTAPRSGEIASGISVTREVSSPASKSKDVVKKSYARKSRANPVAVEIQDNYGNYNIESLERTIRQSSDVISIGRTRLNGKEAIGYTTTGTLKHNVAYIEGSRVYYLASQNFISGN